MKILNKYIVFDIDGTLSNLDHRLHFIEGKGKKDWDGFFSAMIDDLPNKDIILIANALSRFAQIIICTARSEDYRDATEDWLGMHNVPYSNLYMRPTGTNVKDTVVKQHMLDEIGKDNVMMVFDDRDGVVDMWRENGVRCLQVDNGNY